MATPLKTTTKRGYGWAHQRARARWARIVELGEAYCARCRRPIWPGEPWHLDHTSHRAGYLGPSHARCNVTAANRSRKRRPRSSRAW